MSKAAKSPVFWLAILLLAIAAFTLLGPAEKSLGSNVRVVYLHGVWVWTALAGFLAAGLTGLAGLFLRSDNLQRWSRALGRTGLVFWLSYLPISMWAMQTNWNGLFLAEPRWRLAVIFSLGGLVIQLALLLMDSPAWASAANLLYFGALMLSIRLTQNVMHPPSPILDSSAWRIQLYFFGLLLLTMLAAWQVVRWWRKFEHQSI